MIKYLYTILRTLFVFSLFHCNNGTEPEKTHPYASLSKGDITQLINVVDSSTIITTIVDTRFREDGELVYAEQWEYGTQKSLDTSYLYISDGFLIATELDTIKGDSIMMRNDPFREQKLGKIFPESGDTWQISLGDQDSRYWTAAKIDVFSTLFGDINNVAEFSLFNKESSVPILITYYGQGLGWIGTSSGSESIQYLCSYKMVSGKSYGNLWPKKNPVGDTLNIKNIEQTNIFNSIYGKMFLDL